VLIPARLNLEDFPHGTVPMESSKYLVFEHPVGNLGNGMQLVTNESGHMCLGIVEL